MSERKQVLPFFQQHEHLSAFTGSYVPKISEFDCLAFELNLFGDFAADLAIGDSKSNTFCLVEFEDAGKESISRQVGAKASREYSRRFEHGFSQLVDWFYKLDDMRDTAAFENLFGAKRPSLHGLLVVGRDQVLSKQEQARLDWRLQRVQIDTHSIFCVTYDELNRTLSASISCYNAAYYS